MYKYFIIPLLVFSFFFPWSSLRSDVGQTGDQGVLFAHTDLERQKANENLLQEIQGVMDALRQKKEEIEKTATEPVIIPETSDDPVIPKEPIVKDPVPSSIDEVEEQESLIERLRRLREEQAKEDLPPADEPIPEVPPVDEVIPIVDEEEPSSIDEVEEQESLIERLRRLREEQREQEADPPIDEEEPPIVVDPPIDEEEPPIVVDPPIDEEEPPVVVDPPPTETDPVVIGEGVVGLPPEKEGKYPIHMPTYDGVEQIIVLSNKWVIVLTQNIDDVVQKIHDLSGVDFKGYAKQWEDSLKENPDDPNWYVFRTFIEPIRDQYMVEARTLAGEDLLEDPSYFSITSSSDADYSEAQKPLQTTRYVGALGGTEVSGGDDIHYAHFSYLEFPVPMKSGNTYTITLENGKSVTFLYDEMYTVSRAIKVNQMGYLSNTPQKYAYLGAYLQDLGPLYFPEVSEFTVVNVATGEEVFVGPVTLRADNPHMIKAGDTTTDPSTRPLFSGEAIYELDLSGFADEGEFFITIPGVGRSWTFRHAPDVYGEAFFLQMRGMFQQRSGMEISPELSAWSRPAYHTEPVYESDYIPLIPPVKAPGGWNDFDIFGGSTDTSKVTEDATGGWYDAADFDKRIFHYANVFDLLSAFELAPEKFYDGQLHIPESGNGIPDLLDEAEYGLLVWKKSQTPEGGVAGRLETYTHPTYDADVNYAYSRRTRWTTLIYAAAAAQYAHLVRPFSPGKADEYQESAERAYKWGSNPENSLGSITVRAAKGRGFGDPYTVTFVEEESFHIPYLIAAKLRLYKITQDPELIQDVPALLGQTLKPLAWPFSNRDFSPWLYYPIFDPDISPMIPTAIVNDWRNHYIGIADTLVEESEASPYRHSWSMHKDFYMSWGETALINRAKTLLIAFYLTGDPKYREVAILNTDFQHGTNPMGMSWTTGMGFSYPIDIQHAFSEVDGIADPIPGIAIYGITDVIGWPFTQMVWQSQRPDESFVNFMSQSNWNVPTWRRWMPHPHLYPQQNEFTIHETMSAGTFVYALLIPDDWMPNEQLKNRKPRDKKYLFGHWYMP